MSVNPCCPLAGSQGLLRTSMCLPAESGILAAPFPPLDLSVPQNLCWEELRWQEHPMGTRYSTAAESQEWMVRLEILMSAALTAYPHIKRHLNVPAHMPLVHWDTGVVLTRHALCPRHLDCDFNWNLIGPSISLTFCSWVKYLYNKVMTRVLTPFLFHIVWLNLI